MTMFTAPIEGHKLRIDAPTEEAASRFARQIEAQAKHAHAVTLSMGLSEQSARNACDDLLYSASRGVIKITENGKPSSSNVPPPKPLDSVQQYLKSVGAVERSSKTNESRNSVELRERAKAIFKDLGIESEEVQTKGF